MSSNIDHDIEKYGWHAVHVFEEDGVQAPFSYSVGFEESYNHPEVAIFGLENQLAHSILNDIAKDVASSRVLGVQAPEKEILGGDVAVQFAVAKPESHSTHFAQAKYHYGRSFRVLVMLWPDRAGLFPSQPGCEVAKLQEEALGIV